MTVSELNAVTGGDGNIQTVLWSAIRRQMTPSRLRLVIESELHDIEKRLCDTDGDVLAGASLMYAQRHLTDALRNLDALLERGRAGT